MFSFVSGAIFSSHAQYLSDSTGLHSPENNYLSAAVTGTKLHQTTVLSLNPPESQEMICLFTQAGFSCYKPTNEVFGLSVHDNHEARRVDGGKYDAVTESTPSIMSPTRGRRARQMLDSLLTHLLSRLYLLKTLCRK